MSAVASTVGFAAGNAFLLDVDRCTGCHACELACAIENRLSWGRSWRTVFPVDEARHFGGSSFHLSLACNHCADAPCVTGCPARALTRDAATGTVQVDGDRCLGCRYCSWACPFDAPTFDEDSRTMTKCTGCRPRLLEGREPACVQQCPTGALGFGPAGGATRSPGFPDDLVGPALRFRPGGRDRVPPECTWTAPPEAVAELAARPGPDERLGVRSEWPLLVFTLLAAGLVGAAIGSSPGTSAALPLPLFVIGATLAGGVATLHLGRPERAWRAIANVRTSWLSREIAGFGAFTAATVLNLARPDLPGVAGAIALLGVATLFAMDRVYDPVRPDGPWRLHSADVVGTGLLVAAVVRGAWPVVVGITVVKLGLAALRIMRRVDAASLGRVVARVLLGALVPLAAAGDGGGIALPLSLLAVGELLDRIDFYATLVSRGPRTKAHFDARSAHRAAATPS